MKEKIARKYSLIAAFLILLVSIIIGVISFLSLSAFNNSIRKQMRIRSEVQQLTNYLTSITDAETGQRGYIITGKKEYLEPYNKALKIFASPENDVFLESLDRNSLPGKGLKKLIQSKLAEMQDTIELRNTSGFEAAQQTIDTNYGKNLMDQIRVRIAETINSKEVEIDELDRKSIRNSKATFLIIASGELLSLLLLLGCLYMLFNDINMRIVTEQNLTNLNNLHEAVLDSAKQAIITLDFDGKISSANQGFEDHFGYRADEVIHTPFLNMFMENEGQNDSPNRNTSKNGLFLFLMQQAIQKDQIWKMKRKDGTLFDFSMSTSPVQDHQGHVYGYLVIGEDVTVRLDWERKLIDAQEKALIASQAKSRFLANMSHDLRTPLNSIIGFSGLLYNNKKGHFDSEESSFLKRVSDNGKHLLDLINTILDLSKVEEGKSDTEHVSINLKEFIKSILADLEGQILDKNLEFEEVIPESLEPLNTDPQKLKQIMFNLVGNAIKFTSKGKITVTVLKDNANNPIRIDVSDTGKGISSENLSKIFEAFYQVDSGGDRQYGGSGLGLSITAAVCKVLGYKIQVSSRIGLGSVFSIILKEDKASVLTSANYGKLNNANSSQKTILLIDDDADARYLLSQYFKDLGCHTIEASSGAEGIEKAKAYLPDLITLDLKMQPVSGYEVIQTFQNDEILKLIPCLVISAIANEAAGKMAGPKGYLNKPLSFEELKGTLSSFEGFLNYHHETKSDKDDKTTVLVIDDDQDSRFLLTKYFKDLDCNVITASSGAEGIKLAIENSIDLITIDLQMKGMSGYEVIDKLLADERLNKIPFAIISVGADEAAKKINAPTIFLNKPVGFEQLRSLLISKIVSKKH